MTLNVWSAELELKAVWTVKFIPDVTLGLSLLSAVYSSSYSKIIFVPDVTVSFTLKYTLAISPSVSRAFEVVVSVAINVNMLSSLASFDNTCQFVFFFADGVVPDAGHIPPWYVVDISVSVYNSPSAYIGSIKRLLYLIPICIPTSVIVPGI